MNTNKTVPMSVENFQLVLQQMVDNVEIEANAVIGVYNIHKQTMLVVPYWEHEEADDLPIKLAHHLATFADVSGTGESIGAFAFATDSMYLLMDEEQIAGVEAATKQVCNLDRPLISK